MVAAHDGFTDKKSEVPHGRYDRRSYQFYGGRIYGVDDYTTLMRYGVTSYDIMINDFTIYGVTIRRGPGLWYGVMIKGGTELRGMGFRKYTLRGSEYWRRWICSLEWR